MLREDFISEFNKKSLHEGIFSRINTVMYLRSGIGRELGIRACNQIVDDACMAGNSHIPVAEYIYSRWKEIIDKYPCITTIIEEFCIIRCNRCNSTKDFKRGKEDKCSIDNCEGKVVGESIVTNKITMYE